MHRDRSRRRTRLARAILFLLPIVVVLWWRLAAAGESSASVDAASDVDLADRAIAAANVGEAAEDSALLIPVRGVPAVRGTLTIGVTAVAETAAHRDAELWGPDAGRVVRVPVMENEVVREGQELLALDPTDARLEVHEALAGLERARLSYRELTLLDERIVDEAVRAERQRVARIRSGLEEAGVRVEQAELRLFRTVARAPFDGRVAFVDARLGEWVRAGDRLMRVVEIDPIRVEAQVLDSELRWLRPGGAATVEFTAWPGESFAGRIRTINPDVDRELRTAKVTIVVPNPNGRLLPGMYARVRFAARELADRVLVPRSAVLERDRRSMVFVYEGDERGGVARWRWVTTGDGNEQVVELIEAEDGVLVEPGDIVLTGGHVSLIHDARVRLVDDTTSLDETRPE